MRMAQIWPNIFSGTIILIFVLALAGNDAARDIVLEGWEALGVLLTGAGLRMAKDVAMVRAKSRNRGSQDVGGNDL